MPEYQVVALFNWTDQESVLSVTTEELGIESAPRDTYEFWTGAVGSMEDGVLQATVPAHGVRVFSLHEKRDYPQWVGSDRHISMNALEISDYRWEDGTLSMNVNLVGGFPVTQHFRIPDHLHLQKVRCPGARIEETIHDGHLSVTLFSQKNQNVRLELSFRA